METHCIYVVLSRSNTLLSGLIHFFKRDQYTHAALAFNPGLTPMFSFGRRFSRNPFIGCFRREHLNKGLYARHKHLPGLVITLPVEAEAYHTVQKMVEEFIIHRNKYGYNYAGIFSGLFGGGSYSPNRFLCSEFVYHVLHQSGVCDLNRPRHLVRPQDLLRIGGRVIYEGDLKSYTLPKVFVKAEA